MHADLKTSPTGPAALQAQLGYAFKNPALLTRALTHRSRGADNYERLEYLGDSILGFVIAEALFARFPMVEVGNLTRMRAQLVRRETLAARARELGLQHCMRLRSGTGIGDGMLADAFEALLGAVYLDSDLPTVKAILLALFDPHLGQLTPQSSKDYKTRLQERLQKRGLPLPMYEVIEQLGRDHAPVFVVACRAHSLAEPVIARGVSRRIAEQRSARKALELLNADG